jgi:hypothetical protein
MRIVPLLLLASVSMAADAATVQVIEYYNSSQDHYFVSSLADDIQALDSGKFQGWARTGRTFEAYPSATGNASPVCRFYIPPAQGDSHFYSASPAECQQTAAKFPTFIEESTAVMYVDLPDPTSGACPAGDIPVYRVWDNRADSNHRYMIDRNLRTQMIAQGWVAEGYGPDQVIMCAPSTVPAASIAPSCVGSNPKVAFANGPHGMYVWNPTAFPAYQKALASDVIGRDPSLCGASLVVSWASVETSKGVYDWTAVYAAAKPYTDAALTVNLLFAESTEGAVNNVTPAWVMQPVASGGAGAPSVTCPNEPQIPVYWDANYEAAWTAFIAAAIHEFSNNNSQLARSVGYLRFASGGGAEAIAPPNLSGADCHPLWLAAGYSYATWNAHEARIITFMGTQPTDKQVIAALPFVTGGPNIYDSSNMAAAVAVPKHVGISFENLGESNVAAPNSVPAACNPQGVDSNLHWCQAFATYVGQVPFAAQPITATYQTSSATMDIAKLLQYAIANRIQVLELYPYEFTQANSPGSPQFDAAKQAEYQQALSNAALTLGATNGRGP